MKKIVLTLVAVMSLTMSFAADTKNNANAEQGHDRQGCGEGSEAHELRAHGQADAKV